MQDYLMSDANINKYGFSQELQILFMIGPTLYLATNRILQISGKLSLMPYIIKKKKNVIKARHDKSHHTGAETPSAMSSLQ